MLRILAITGPIYLVIALGYVCVRAGVFGKGDMRVLGGFVYRIALPALIFAALSQRRVDEILDARYLLDYALGSLAILLAAFAWGYWRQRKGLALSAVSAMGMCCSNSGYIGFPIALQVVGASTAAAGLAMCMVIENLLMIPLALLIAESGAGSGGSARRVLGQSAAQLARNPIILAMLAGCAVALGGVRLPDVATRAVALLAQASTAVSLFVIGGMLVGLSMKGLRRDVGAIALGKLVLHPLAVGLLIAWLPPADPRLAAVAVIYASVPMLGIYPILAQKYGHEGIAAAAMLAATLLSFVTIGVVLWHVAPGLAAIG